MRTGGGLRLRRRHGRGGGGNCARGRGGRLGDPVGLRRRGGAVRGSRPGRLGQLVRPDDDRGGVRTRLGRLADSGLGGSYRRGIGGLEIGQVLLLERRDPCLADAKPSLVDRPSRVDGALHGRRALAQLCLAAGECLEARVMRGGRNGNPGVGCDRHPEGEEERHRHDGDVQAHHRLRHVSRAFRVRPSAPRTGARRLASPLRCRLRPLASVPGTAARPLAGRSCRWSWWS